MGYTTMLVASLFATLWSQQATAVCGKDAFEPDFNAPTGTVFVGGTSQQRNFCDDAEDWMSIHVCPGRAYALDTSALGAAADTLIELYAEDGTTLLALDEDEEPDPTGHLAWTASSSQSGTLHARVRQRDGTHGNLRDYQIRLTGDTSPCTVDVTSVVHVPGESMLFEAIAQSVDGGFVSVGSLTSLGALPDLAVTRWNIDGTIGWIRRLGDGTSQGGREVARTADGGFATLAYNDGPKGSLVAKLTDDGAVSWQTLYGAGYDDALDGIAASPDGSIYAAGYLDSPASAGGFDGWLMKLNASGTPDWSLRLGSARDEFLFEIQALKDGRAVAAGTVERAAGGSGAILLEVSAAGVVVKQTVFHTNAARGTEFDAVRPLPDGGYLVGGDLCTGDFVCAALILKLTAAGAIAWQRTLDWSGTVDKVMSIDTLQDGSIYAHVQRTGRGNDEPIITRWSANGTLLGQFSLGAVNGGVVGVVSDDGGIAVSYGEGPNLRLARTDATGNVPYCAFVSAVDGVLGTPALTASASSLGTGILVEPAPSASLAITSTVRSVEGTCACPRAMSTPIYVTGRSNTAISWANDGFGPYDLVRGDLTTLQTTGGDFTAALNAIPSSQQCLGQDLSGTFVYDTYAQPLPDTGYFYLVRGGNGTQFVCATLYDEGGHQLGHRDAEITAASGPCP